MQYVTSVFLSTPDLCLNLSHFSNFFKLYLSVSHFAVLSPLLQILMTTWAFAITCLFFPSPSLQRMELLCHLWSGYRWVCVACGQLHTAVWRLHDCCCCCCCCGCCLIMSLWHWAAVSLADRQVFAPVTAASCHLGLTEWGGQEHANRRTWDKVIHILPY